MKSMVLLSLVALVSPLACSAGSLELPDGAFLYYESKGKGTPILLVHGWTMSSKLWSRQLDSLSQDFQVIAVDLRAHGNSSKTLTGHTIPQYAKDLRTLIEALDLRGVTLVGWSLGGPVVLEYWKQYGADRVGALGLVDCTICPFSAVPWNSHALRDHNYDGMHAALQKLQDDRKAFGEKFINNMLKSGAATPEDMAWILKEFLKVPAPAAMAIYSDFMMRDYTDVLETITVPAGVFAADSNIFKSGIDMGRHISSQIRNSTFVAFEKSGHMPFYEEADKFNTALKELSTPSRASSSPAAP